MSNRRKGYFPRNNSKGYFNQQPFRTRNDKDHRKMGGPIPDFHGGGGTSFKHQGRYDAHNNRFDPVYIGRSKSKRGGRNRHQSNQPRPVHHWQDMQSGWYKITVPHGKKLTRDNLVKSLISCSQSTFIPINYHMQGQSAVFYVDSKQDADMLRQCSRRLTTPDGLKIILHVGNSPPPPTPLNEENLQKIKVAMSNKFDVNTCNLDLRSFHLNQDLKNQGLHAPLAKESVLHSVVKIISSNIPQIRSLDMSSNKLRSLNGSSDLVSDCKDLKSLNLKNNILNSMNDLNSIKGCAIEELILDGNPLCDYYKDQDSYISDVRSRFPRVVKLDGQVLPPPIVFDLGTTETLPKVKGSYFPTQDLATNVLHFLETYFGIYDSDNRQPLVDAYHDEACYSLHVAKSHSRSQDNKLLSEYLYSQGNRNLFKVTDQLNREKFLRQGKVAIVSQLCNLPKTQHFPASITVDVSHLSSALMMFTVSGLFKEVDSSANSVKAFTRNFLVVPHEQGIQIINEMHLIASPTGAQLKAHRAATSSASAANPSASSSSEMASAPMGSSVISAPVGSSVIASLPPVGGIVSEETKKQIVHQLVSFSGMNIPYSTKCLEEVNWDLKGAMQIFTELNARGGIPAEAFQAL